MMGWDLVLITTRYPLPLYIEPRPHVRALRTKLHNYSIEDIKLKVLPHFIHKYASIFEDTEDKQINRIKHKDEL